MTPPALAMDSSLRELDDHADRIRSLESTHTQVAAQLAAQSVQIDQQMVRTDQQTAQIAQLERSTVEGLGDLGQRLESFARPLTEKVEEHERILGGIQRVRDERRKLLKGWMIAGLTFLVGAVAKEGGQRLLSFLHLLP